MRHRPRVSIAFTTLAPSILLRSTKAPLPTCLTFSTPLPPLTPSRRLSFLPPCMVSHKTTTGTIKSSNTSSSTSTRYGAISSQLIPSQPSPIEPPQPPSPSPPPPPPPPAEDDHFDKRLLIVGAGLLALFFAGSVAAATGALNADTLVSIAAWFETLGPWAVFLYAGIYFCLELVAVPALPLTLGSGYLFGLAKGTAAVSVASTLAAVASFIIARYGLRDSINKIARRYPKFQAMDRAIGKESFKFVLLLRLSPLLPFALSNYLYGLTSVNLAEYVLGSWLGMLPGTIAYVSAGAAVSALTDLGDGGSQVSPILLLIGVAATIGALTFIGKLAADAVTSADEDEIAQGH